MERKLCYFKLPWIFIYLTTSFHFPVLKYIWCSWNHTECNMTQWFRRKYLIHILLKHCILIKKKVIFTTVFLKCDYRVLHILTGIQNIFKIIKAWIKIESWITNGNRPKKNLKEWAKRPSEYSHTQKPEHASLNI